MPDLDQWDSFYVVIGSAAGALIGLMFVVMTLIADRPASRRLQDASMAFATPTVVHFSAVLFLSAVARVPWPGAAPLAVVWGLLGIVGAAYELIVGRRVKVQTAFEPETDDWLFHFLFPFVGYVLIVAAALATPFVSYWTPFAVGAAVLVLLFTGIRNAWDDVAYIAINRDVRAPRTAAGATAEEQPDHPQPTVSTARPPGLQARD
jgi:hypothetical protein